MRKSVSSAGYAVDHMSRHRLATHTCTAQSSCDAEFHSLVNTIATAIGINPQLMGVRVLAKDREGITARMEPLASN